MDIYDELLGDDLAGLLNEPDLELGKFSFGKMLKSVGKVARGALKVAKIIPGVGSIAAAADMGLDVADKIGSGLKTAKKAVRDVKGVAKSVGINLGGKGKKASPAQKRAAAASPTAKRIAKTAAVSAKRQDVAKRPTTSTIQTRAAIAERETTPIARGGSPEAQAARAAPAPTVVVQAAPLDVASLVRQFSAQVSPQLSAVASAVGKMNLQAQVTAEHKKRASDTRFRAQVLKQLGRRA